MNVQTAIEQRTPLKINAEGFLLLRQSGAFAGYGKTELLDGELWGCPLQAEDEPESDAEYPIKLTVECYEMLHRAGMFSSLGKTELVDGLIYEMSPQYRPHGFLKDELTYRLRRSLESAGIKLHVATEQSVAIAP